MDKRFLAIDRAKALQTLLLSEAQSFGTKLPVKNKIYEPHIWHNSRKTERTWPPKSAPLPPPGGGAPRGLANPHFVLRAAFLSLGCFIPLSEALSPGLLRQVFLIPSPPGASAGVLSASATPPSVNIGQRPPKRKRAQRAPTFCDAGATRAPLPPTERTTPRIFAIRRLPRGPAAYRKKKKKLPFVPRGRAAAMKAFFGGAGGRNLSRRVFPLALGLGWAPLPSPFQGWGRKNGRAPRGPRRP